MEANFKGADLKESNFSGADLNGAVLRDANFQDVNFTNAKGLQSKQFAGANVSGAKLPIDIAKFEGLTQVEKVSQRAQRLFVSLLLGCIYCWLTIASTTDAELIVNSRSSPLPIIQTQVSISGFYWAAPIILLCLYIWFHLYLQRLWEKLSQLPAIFVDGETLNEKVCPWLITGIALSYVPRLKECRPALSRVQIAISILLAWWLVPFTFLLFWLRYIPRRDWVGTTFHMGELAVGITAAILLFHLARKTLRGERTFTWPWKELTTLSTIQNASLMLGILGFSFLIFYTLTFKALEGVQPPTPTTSLSELIDPATQAISFKWFDSPVLIPRLLDYLAYGTRLNLEEADISIKPPAWTGQKENLADEIKQVKGANLEGANLKHARMFRAFLIKANLIRADLREADLRRAQLQEAFLGRSKLTKANMKGADLSGASLTFANLEGAILVDSKLRNSKLKFTHFERADLFGVDLTKSNLMGAQLQEANLTKARLFEASLAAANLGSADLSDANLQKTDLRMAILTHVKNLTQAQLDKACVDETTELPKGLTRPPPCPKEELPPLIPPEMPFFDFLDLRDF